MFRTRFKGSALATTILRLPPNTPQRSAARQRPGRRGSAARGRIVWDAVVDHGLPPVEVGGEGRVLEPAAVRFETVALDDVLWRRRRRWSARRRARPARADHLFITADPESPWQTHRPSSEYCCGGENHVTACVRSEESPISIHLSLYAKRVSTPRAFRPTPRPSPSPPWTPNASSSRHPPSRPQHATTAPNARSVDPHAATNMRASPPRPQKTRKAPTWCS